MARNKQHIATRVKRIETARRPLDRAMRNHSERVQLEREAQAYTERGIAKAIDAIEGLTALTPYEGRRRDLSRALISDAQASRRAYEADISEGSTHGHITPCGPAKAIQGRAFYAVLKAKHDSSEYMAVTQDGVYSHSKAISGPARVDAINLMSDRLPATDALASVSIGHTRALNRYNSDIRHSIHMATKLSARSHRKSSKRGNRKRGKGGKRKIDGAPRGTEVD